MKDTKHYTNPQDELGTRNMEHVITLAFTTSSPYSIVSEDYFVECRWMRSSNRPSLAIRSRSSTISGTSIAATRLSRLPTSMKEVSVNCLDPSSCGKGTSSYALSMSPPQRKRNAKRYAHALSAHWSCYIPCPGSGSCISTLWQRGLA